MGIKSTVRGPCMVNVAWEEQANGPEGAYCRVFYSLEMSNAKRFIRVTMERCTTERYRTSVVVYTEGGSDGVGGGYNGTRAYN